MLNENDKIFVAGHRGMVGSAIVRQLKSKGHTAIITRTHRELDLTSQQAVADFFSAERPDVVILAAAKVGGILANDTYPADFIYQNLMIETNVIHYARLAGVQHLSFLGSSCIYPKFAPQPIKENDLLTGLLEPTNEAYAIAKIAGIKICESYNKQYGTVYRSVMPTNLYGPADNYNLETSHVIPAMIRKFHLAKLAEKGDVQGIIKDEEVYGKIPDDIVQAIGYDRTSQQFNGTVPAVILWGTGRPRREFLHVDDMASASLHVLDLPRERFLSPNPSFVNVGTGVDITIQETASIIAECIGFSGKIIFDEAKPDGTPQKLLDISRLNSLGWQPVFSFREGIADAYRDYCSRLA